MESRVFLGTLAVLALAGAATAQSSSFNIDVGTSNAAPSAAYAAATAQAGFWNAVNATVATPVLLTDIAGVPSASTSLTITGCNANFNFNNGATLGDDELLMDDLQDLSAGASTTWTVGPLAGGSYRVTVYSWAPDFPPDETQLTVVGGSLGLQLLTGSTGWTGFVLGQTHVQDNVNLAAGGSVVVTADGAPGSFGSINGVQVELVLAAPVVYCTAKLGSTGCLPSIAATGTSSASATSGFTVSSSNNRNQKPGLLMYSFAGRAAAPFGGGTQCIAAPVQRTPTQGSGGSPLPTQDCSGVYSIDMNAYASGNLGGNPNPLLLLPGTIVNCQWLGRDPGFGPPNNISLSDAVEYTVGL